MPRGNDWFWIALGLVAAMVVVIAAKNVFAGRPRDRRWGRFIVLATFLAAGCADQPHAPLAAHAAPIPTCGTGWDDCTHQDDQADL